MSEEGCSRNTGGALIGEYRTLVTRALDRLDEASVDTVVEVAELPDLVRGYEQIKLDGMERMRRRAHELAGRLEERKPTCAEPPAAGV